jgi:hypothetical protein
MIRPARATGTAHEPLFAGAIDLIWQEEPGGQA